MLAGLRVREPPAPVRLVQTKDSASSACHFVSLVWVHCFYSKNTRTDESPWVVPAERSALRDIPSSLVLERPVFCFMIREKAAGIFASSHECIDTKQIS